MMLKLALPLLIVIVLLGCSDDSTPALDATVARDGGAMVDQQVTAADLASPDQQNKQEGTRCWQIILCEAACPQNDTVCVDNCLLVGSSEAQKRYLELKACEALAEPGPCKTQCQQGGQACIDCLLAACKKEMDKCSDDGSASAGFGDLCMGTCSQGFECFSIIGKNFGVCTKVCPELGKLCTDAPQGMVAGCLLPSGAKNVCGFICKASGKTFVCPKYHKCSPTQIPAGSGQYPCLPEYP